jgi:hypothetical protein
MRSLVWLALLSLALVIAPATMVRADNNVGCGLGTQLWEGKSGVVFQVLAATTNGTLGNQTFGITSGTLGCATGATITAEQRLSMFAGGNIDHLARDMAVGEGEALTALAQLLQIPQADRAAFYQLAKDNFADIFTSEEVTAGEMLGALDRLMAGDARLQRYARS